MSDYIFSVLIGYFSFKPTLQISKHEQLITDDVAYVMHEI